MKQFKSLDDLVRPIRIYSDSHFDGTYLPFPFGDRPGEMIPSNDALCSCGAPARMAYAIMLRSGDELIDMHKKVDHGHVDELMTSMADGAEKLKAIAHMLEVAYERVLASACAHHVGGGKFKGVA